MDAQTARPKFRRKQYLILKEFQLKYVGIILLLMFLTAALCSYVVYYTSMIVMGEKLANVYPQGRLMSIVNIVNSHILLSLILVTPLVVIMGIFLSHKIAGPLFRIERTIRNMTSGDLSEHIVLRKGDQLASLADVVNDMSDKLRQDISANKERLTAALASIDTLKRKSQGGADVDNIEKNIKLILDDLERQKLKK